MKQPFKNEAVYDFKDEGLRKEMQEAVAGVEAEAGTEYDLIIGGDRVKGDGTFETRNPSNKDQVLGVFQKATPDLAQKAIETADAAFESWSRTPAEERAEYLFKAAEVMRRRRLELDATMVLEEGKNWIEADADTCEAIDFLEFYGREMLRYAQPQPLTEIPGEQNEYFYIPLGVGVVIPPWNFPLAILVGMTSAAFVTGNTVVLKPSSDSPLIGRKFMEILEEIKLPAGVVNFVTGSGGAIGNTLVGHPRTRFISFTGSRDVGLGIVELAAKTQPGQIWIKRVVAEMGGKDAMVIDADCDLDMAAKAVKTAAFGFQGQKCSACSRAIVVDDVYDEFLEKLVKETETITVGPVREQENWLGPVINQRAMDSILKYIEIGQKEGGRLLHGGKPAGDAGNGFFIEPTIIADVKSRDTIGQEEIFGPVCAVIKAQDFDDAIRIANDTEYGLTGAVITNSREKLDKARREFHVGNLYFNRKCTGALVDVHPFGGFNMSGTDSKAGSRDYLLLFLQGKSVSEKV
ncbi:MAG: L-glutamate gamma-semialdehyde dehydrogenase [Candidatus Eisenbacteria bacterium]|nr:L-glutamate gamma-semialdehyde dehydrogenase [Candidatus Eisenbacteria bacterium]